MNKFLSKKIIVIVIALTLLLIVMIYKRFCEKKSNISDLSDEPTQIIFDPQVTYKKAVHQLPDNLKILENSDNSTIKLNTKIKSEIHFLLKNPFFQIKPIITNQTLLKKDIITHYDEGICNSISFKINEVDQQINICERDTNFYNESKKIKGKLLNKGVLTFTLKNNLFFDNGESINVNTIEHTLRTYLNSKNNLFDSTKNKHLFWIGQLKNALNYYKSNKLEKDKKLTCFNKIDNNKFALIFEYDYIKNISLYEIIKNLNQLFLLPQSINELDNYGNSYNDLISYGNYKIDKYVPNSGLLLTNRVDVELLNIFYLVISQEQDKINLWNNHQLNEMELNENSIKQSLRYDYESSNFDDNEIIGLIANPGNRNDASLYSSRGFSGNHKLCPAIIRDTNFKKVLQTIINKIFFTSNNNIEDLKIKDVISFCAEDDIKELIKRSYDYFISQHPEQNIVEFDLVCENNEKQKELANRLKEEIENLKNIDYRIYFKINIKPVSLKQHVLIEFQKAFDLIITNIKLISNEWEFYLHLLEKLNLETIELKLLEKGFSNDEREYFKTSSIFNNFNLNSLNLEQIKQLITQEAKNELEIKCLNSLLKTIKNFIKEKNCLFLLSDNKKYIVYQKNINYQSTWKNFLDIVVNLFSFQEN